MKITLLISFIFIASCFVQAFAQEFRFEPLLGLEGLHTPRESRGRFHRQSVRHTVTRDGKVGVVRLDYDVEHAENHIALETLNVTLRRCKLLPQETLDRQGLVEVDFGTPLLARQHPFQVGSVVSGGREYGCRLHRAASMLMHRVTAVNGVSGSVVTLETEEAAYTDVFKNANIDFYVSAFPDDQFEEYQQAEVVRATADTEDGFASHFGAASRKRGVGSFLRKTWSKAKSLGKKVADVAKKVPGVIGAIAKGKYDKDYAASRDLSFNFDRRLDRAGKNWTLSAGVTCSNCYGKLEAGIKFSLHIDRYQLLQLDASVSASAVLMLQSTFEFDGAFELAKDIPVTTVKMGSIKLVIGVVPVFIDLTMPVEIGVAVQAQARATLVSTVQARGSLVYGIAYDRSSGFRSIADQDLRREGKVESVSGSVNVEAIVSLQPTLVMRIDYIGGPTIGLFPFAELLINGGTGMCAAAPDEWGLRSTLNWGLQVALGAHIDIRFAGKELYKKEWDAGTLVSLKNPVFSKCLTFGKTKEPPAQPKAPSQQLTMQRVVEGTAWDGALQEPWWLASMNEAQRREIGWRPCPLQLLGATVSMQAIDLSNVTSPAYTVAVIKDAVVNGLCQAQAEYRVTHKLDLFFMRFVYVTRVPSSEVEFSMCVDGEVPPPLYDTYILTYMAHQEHEFGIQSPDFCVTSLLTPAAEQLMTPRRRPESECAELPLSFERDELVHWEVYGAAVALTADALFQSDGEQSGSLSVSGDQFGVHVGGAPILPDKLPMAPALPFGATYATVLYPFTTYDEEHSTVASLDCGRYVTFDMRSAWNRHVNFTAPVQVRVEVRTPSDWYYSSFVNVSDGISAPWFDMQASAWKTRSSQAGADANRTIALSSVSDVDQVQSIGVTFTWQPELLGTSIASARFSIDAIRVTRNEPQPHSYVCCNVATILKKEPCRKELIFRTDQCEANEPMMLFRSRDESGAVQNCDDGSVWLAGMQNFEVWYVEEKFVHACNYTGMWM